MSDQLKSMKECLMATAQAQMSNLENVDAKELGEVVDMIKDLEEAAYYCAITKSMEEAKKEDELMAKVGIDPSTRYYNDNRYRPDRYPIRMMDGMGGRRGYNLYYPDVYDPLNDFYRNKGRLGYSGMSGNSGNSTGGTTYTSSGNTGSTDGNGGMRNYDHYPQYPQYPDMRMNESNYDRARRRYTETKMTHTGNTTEDKTANMASLEEYIKELGVDMSDMIQGATPEEKTALKQKLTTLASKL